MREQLKPQESMTKLGVVLQEAAKSICIHEEFQSDCAKCLRAEVRKLRRQLNQQDNRLNV